MHSSATLEYDIRTRTRTLAEALASQSNLPIDYESLLSGIDAEIAEVDPLPDQLTWFAIERLASKTGLAAVKFETPGQSVRPASLLWVAPNISPNEADAREMSKASLVVASDGWKDLIRQANNKPRRPGP